MMICSAGARRAAGSVRAEVRAKTPTSGAARAGIPDGGGLSRWGVPAKARTPLRSIPDLADVADGDGDVPTCRERVVIEGILNFNSILERTVFLVLGHVAPARHRIEFHIVKLNHIFHDDFSKEFVSVNNIWLEANQCLTARVITMKTDFYLCEKSRSN
jgi:hypothetical protein